MAVPMTAPVPLMDTTSQWAALRPRLDAAIAEVLDSGRFILGPNVAAFERESAAYLGAPHAVGVANGTEAISLALRAIGVGPGDEVVCPAYTFYATAEAIATIGAVPVFADIDAGTFQLDPAAAEAAITPRTRAIVPVHLFGHPAPMAAITAIASRHGLAVLEDAAQAFGARIDGQPCGGLADAATFSFFPTKNLGGFGDGGLVTARSEAVADTLRMLRFHGSRDKQTFELVGVNSRLDELQAAVLRVLLPSLDGWNTARRAAAARYAELGLGEHVGLPGTAPGAEPIYHLYVVRVEAGERAATVERLKERGVAAAVYYATPAHLQPVFAHLGYLPGSLPETERAGREGVALPMFPTITAAQQEAVVAAFRA